jgi:hypothetical protein
MNENIKKMYKHISDNNINNINNTNNIIDLNRDYTNSQKQIIQDNYNNLKFGDISSKQNIINPIYLPESIIQNINKNSNSDFNNESNEDYDPLLNYYNKKGLLYKNVNVRYNVEYIHIDSKDRKILPILTYSNTYSLPENPLQITHSSNDYQSIITVSFPNNLLNINNQITLSTLLYKQITYQYAVRNTLSSTGYNTIINFMSGSKYALIYADPNITIKNSTIDGATSTYNTKNMIIEISGLSGTTSPNYIGNIPVNLLNTTHQVLLVKPHEVSISDDMFIGNDNVPIDSSIPSQSYFFIELPSKFSGSIEYPSYNFNINYHYYGGIPISSINAEFPIDYIHSTGFHLVNSSTSDSFSFIVPHIGYYKGKFGGFNLYVGLIDQIISGYQNPNYYKINLNKIYTNIVLIKLKSIIIPNTQQVFTSLNNKLYFRNIDDGDHIYQVNIPPGNYDSNTLASLIQTEIYNIPRINPISNTAYSQINYCIVDILSNSSLVTISSYKQAKLSYPISNVFPEIIIGQNPASSYTITIQQKGHGLAVGDSILISGMIDHIGIPAFVLNTNHKVTEILGINKYKIIISNFNFSNNTANSLGGNAVVIYVPNNFQLDFSYSDTIGTQLGFRNAGKNLAKTTFNTVHTNAEGYLNEPSVDPIGNPIEFTQNTLQLSGPPYIFMTCREITTGFTSSGITNVFAKIHLAGVPGKLLYDSFVSTPIYFYEPINLSSLTFEFYNPDGTLFNFNGADNSFTLEITTLDNTPDGTGIMPNLTIER